ncbi:MAG: class I SAM-dependent methyltransferase [Bdellovibrionales bacterium]|nr:class I SAM-dependent methyltransferase [Bdellovibrionales bacterium]
MNSIIPPAGAGRFPDWEQLYQTSEISTLPWYTPELDADLAAELQQRNLDQGTFLDVGTGPGTQAIQLQKLGFTVTGTDLSVAAIDRAQKLSTQVTFIQDDILRSKITGPFDFIFDRGCFHTLDPESRAEYVRAVARMLAPRGLLFLKTFSHEQPGDWGPHRFTANDLRNIFGATFFTESVRATIYQGTLAEQPKALFAVLRKK